MRVTALGDSNKIVIHYPISWLKLFLWTDKKVLIQKKLFSWTLYIFLSCIKMSVTVVGVLVVGDSNHNWDWSLIIEWSHKIVLLYRKKMFKGCCNVTKSIGVLNGFCNLSHRPCGELQEPFKTIIFECQTMIFFFHQNESYCRWWLKTEFLCVIQFTKINFFDAIRRFKFQKNLFYHIKYFLYCIKKSVTAVGLLVVGDSKHNFDRLSNYVTKLTVSME